MAILGGAQLSHDRCAANDFECTLYRSTLRSILEEVSLQKIG